MSSTVAEARRRGIDSWSIRLPARVESLVAPLGLDPAQAFRVFVFRLPEGKQPPA